MPTCRETIVELLSDAEYTPRDLALALGVRIRDVLADLEHVRRSVGKRFQLRPASCERCGYVFRGRERLGTPSRCPRCKCERTAGPWLSVT